ncbi:shikimate 5-dehydrogenase [Klebsiella pneumoniae]|uniref:Shikimate 5-dehydrogenase n=1 Tax=Klebsiella pneumoniae TaxID=573 RepID=A0A378BZ89_KLEPN|nr:shikimate 5-dehydrogenase [Klebsiella pneumoniae]
MVISGNTRLIAHLGYPTASFKAPMIYNPWFVDQQVDVKVVPMGGQAGGLRRVYSAAVYDDQHHRRAGDDAA